MLLIFGSSYMKLDRALELHCQEAEIPSPVVQSPAPSPTLILVHRVWVESQHWYFFNTLCPPMILTCR